MSAGPTEAAVCAAACTLLRPLSEDRRALLVRAGSPEVVWASLLDGRFERVPPLGYGGTERIIHGLVTEMIRRGHDVTTFASADSDVPGRHVHTVAEALRPAGYLGDHLPWFVQTMQQVLDEAESFDVIHAHLEWMNPLIARLSPVPVVATYHGRLDLPWAPSLLRDAPPGYIAISESQASTHPSVPWAAIIHTTCD